MHRTIGDLQVRLREIHHRIRGQLQLIASLLSMQAHRSDDERVSRALGDAVLRILTIASIDDHLRDQPATTVVEMRSALGAIIDLARQTVGAPDSEVTIAHDLEAFTLPPELAVTCGLVVNELVTNALQHAFTGTRGGQVEVRAGAHAGLVTIVVQDDGVGLRPDHVPGTQSMGLDLVRLLVEKQMRGELSLERAGGTRCVVRFPLPTRPTAPTHVA
jgi:two-component sensor histidine kinase